MRVGRYAACTICLFPKCSTISLNGAMAIRDDGGVHAVFGMKHIGHAINVRFHGIFGKMHGITDL